MGHHIAHDVRTPGHGILLRHAACLPPTSPPAASRTSIRRRTRPASRASPVRLLAGRLVRVLEQVAADPGVRVSEIDVLGEDERSRVVGEWNATERSVSGVSLVELFAARAAACPDAVAVVGAGGEEWSYAQLGERADRVAGALAGRGVGRGDLVGVVMERSVELVAVWLGVLRVGAGFVPVDVGWPVARRGLVLGQVGLVVA
ncbi:AMP-binding protein, partial [Streptomyces asiaticus]